MSTDPKEQTCCQVCHTETEPWHVITLREIGDRRVCVAPSQCIERAKKKGLWKRYLPKE